MNTICRDIFRAIHERKWLSIEYKNGKDEVTKYWIGIMEIDPIRKSMHVMGLHLGQYTTMSLYIYIDSILSSAVIEGSYFETKQELIDDITYNQGKYRRIFDTLEKNKDDRTRRTEKLTKLLQRHEERIELKEREEAILK